MPVRQVRAARPSGRSGLDPAPWASINARGPQRSGPERGFLGPGRLAWPSSAWGHARLGADSQVQPCCSGTRSPSITTSTIPAATCGKGLAASPGCAGPAPSDVREPGGDSQGVGSRLPSSRPRLPADRPLGPERAAPSPDSGQTVDRGALCRGRAGELGARDGSPRMTPAGAQHSPEGRSLPRPSSSLLSSSRCRRGGEHFLLSVRCLPWGRSVRCSLPLPPRSHSEPCALRGVLGPAEGRVKWRALTCVAAWRAVDRSSRGAGIPSHQVVLDMLA